MSCFANPADLGTLLELTVPSYGLRLIRRFGAQRVGWFVTAAFASLAALHLLGGSVLTRTDPGSSVLTKAVYAFIILLLLIGMGHLDTVFSICRRSIRTTEGPSRCRRAPLGTGWRSSVVMSHRARPAASASAGSSLRVSEAGCPNRFHRLGPTLGDLRSQDLVRQLAGCLGQDLNNALAIICGQARLLLTRSTDPTSAEQLKQILTAATRARTYSRQLLVVGGRYLLQRKPVALNVALANVGLPLRCLLGEHIQLRKAFAPGLPLILADSRLLEHAILNLVLDARDSLRGRGTIVLTTAAVELGIESAGANRQAKPGHFVRLGIRTINGRPGMKTSFPRLGSHAGAPVVAGLRRASVSAAIAQLATWSETVRDGETSSEFRIYFTPMPQA